MKRFLLIFLLPLSAFAGTESVVLDDVTKKVKNPMIKVGVGNTLDATGGTLIGFGGTGTVTSVAVSGANGIGVSGSPITTSGTISLSLGAITPTTVNGLTFSALATGFSIAGGTTSRTLTVPVTGTIGTAAFADISDTSYDATSWNGNSDAATKNAIRDKIESLSSGGDSITVDGAATTDPNFDDGGDINFAYSAPDITATVKANSVALTTDTTGNYVASVATSAPLSGGAAGSEGSTLTLSITADGIGPTQIDETANYDWTGVHVFDSDALRIDDTNASNQLIITPGSNLTADRVLNITTGDADRTITLSGDTTLSGTNTGDQTSIVGITGTLAQFNTALTGADFATGGGTVTGTSSGTNTGDQTLPVISDVAYDESTWNANLDGASKNAIRDKIESMSVGGGTPGGSDTEVQYNDAGAFDGITGATTDGITMTLVSPVITTPTGIVKGDVGLGNVTNDVQTKHAIVPNTAPSAGQILVGNAGGTAYAPATLSGSGITASLSDAGVLTLSGFPTQVSDTAFASSWNGVTTVAPSKNATYDWAHIFDTDDDGKVNVLDIGAGIVTTDSGGVVSAITNNSTNWDTAFAQTRQWDGGATGLVAATGRTSLGATTVGGNIFTLTNPSAISFLRMNADNTVTARSASDFRTDIGAGTGNGDALTANSLAQFASTTSAQMRTLLSDENGTGVALFDSATSPTFITPALGTPSALVLTNATGLPVGSITGLGSGVATWLATPSSANLATAVTGETGSGALVFGTSPAITTPTGIVKGDVGLGNVDNTSNSTGRAATATLTNKRINPRVTAISSNATWSPNADTDDVYEITAQAAAVTVISNPSGTPVDMQSLIIRVKDNGTARALTWSGTEWRASSDLALPTTTILSKTLYLKFLFNSADTKWDLVALLNNF